MIIGRVSRRTYVIASLMFGLVGVVAFDVALRAGGEWVSVATSDLGSAVSVAVAAAVCLWVAFSFGPGEALRRSWTFVGVGVAAFAIGDIAWAYYEIFVGAVPFPGLPDLFYLASVPLIGLGMVSYAMGFRQLVDWHRPAYISWALTAAALALVWFGVLQPYVFSDPTLSVAEKLVSAAYPLFDVLAIFGPAVYLAATITAMGAGRLGWPWWCVTAGSVLLAVSDSGFAYLQASGAYALGHPVDYGWMLGFSLIALGALLQRDVAVV